MKINQHKVLHTPIFLLFFIALTLISCSGSSDQSEQLDTTIRDDFPFASRYVDVFGSRMHYVDEGSGEVILLLHGNPESVYSWRNIIPHLTPTARVIAVDLIGMGKSAKPDLDYTFLDHAAYLEEFIRLQNLTNITIVGHDWGSGLEFYYATRHQDNVRGLAFMEAVLDVDTWANHSKEYREMYEYIRSDVGSHLQILKTAT